MSPLHSKVTRDLQCRLPTSDCRLRAFVEPVLVASLRQGAIELLNWANKTAINRIRSRAKPGKCIGVVRHNVCELQRETSQMWRRLRQVWASNRLICSRKGESSERDDTLIVSFNVQMLYGLSVTNYLYADSIVFERVEMKLFFFTKSETAWRYHVRHALPWSNFAMRHDRFHDICLPITVYIYGLSSHSGNKKRCLRTI